MLEEAPINLPFENLLLDLIGCRHHVPAKNASLIFQYAHHHLGSRTLPHRERYRTSQATIQARALELIRLFPVTGT